ncbi:phosphoribosylaminoimidazolesuccinocarboxamide synthase [Aeoliella sp. SH292]|uniref:phosphoribosylaminoimidazolesuccinocarboxamide synthase n=1 Tax=Aeoliella sp. SH292 TaxID=3454464 RepID=UPI003F947891
MPSEPLIESQVGNLPAKRGKVRDVYDLGEYLLLVATDRISAFDWVLPTGIPDKGRVLTGVSQFWFDHLQTPHHLITTDVDQMPLPEGTDREVLRGRSMLTKKAKVVPMECVVRGYLAGSGWNEYRESGEVCGVKLPGGLVESDRLPEPIFTPATKAEMGEHDENISFERMASVIGTELAEELRTRSIDLFNRGSEHAARCGLLFADTKFEFGHCDGELILIDEVMTPDSSRFWPADQYHPGGPQPSFDKQFVRDWLLASTWDRNSAPPELPEEIVAKTRAKYIEAFERLTGAEFAWK